MEENEVWKDKQTHYSIKIHHIDEKYIWVTYPDTGDSFPFKKEKFYERFEKCGQ